MKPRIGIGSGCTDNNERGFTAALGHSYLRSVTLAGGAPVIIPITDDPDVLDACLGGVDGVIVPGGPDLPPSDYGETPLPMVEEVAPPRRGFDMRLCRRAIELGLPVLGICHGCQVVNVALGGSLYQDILTEFPDSPLAHRRRLFPYYTSHPVSVEPGSRVAAILGGTRVETNSAHHQSAKRIGEGLRIVARADDGVVEAVEHEDRSRFILGIQWHPEKLAEKADGPHRAIFRALVEASLARSLAAK